MIGSENCDDSCGFLAASFGASCYGSYGVPVKSTSSVNIHPLVIQSYKTVVVFVSSLVVVFNEEWPSWTSYGLLSGLLWVCGGTLGIFAIRNSGMAAAVGIWSSIMVIINFVWGILVFREPIHSLARTCGAFLFLGIGLIGMTKFSSPSSIHSDDSSNENHTEPKSAMDIEFVAKKEGVLTSEPGLTSRTKRGANSDEPTKLSGRPTDDAEYESDKNFEKKNSSEKNVALLNVLGRPLTRWQAGAVCAGLNGLLAGSSLVPLHYAKLEGYSDLSYYISFTSGALIVNVSLWVILYLAKVTHSSVDTLMPRWYVKELGIRLVIAGLLSNGGMFGSILATSSLGQAVGNSLIQLKIFISGLWGICYFQEIKDRRSTISWFLSATICVTSILCLTYERRKIPQEEVVE
mmetsp:Transcript_25221/g.69547  ORF Transcript_25221/g.69547 Transcript_25221/m.69547 type:complete len:405 (+) Transcript_25221:90-1304(+)